MASSFRGAGVIGLPPQVKEGGKRVDFKALNSANDTDFDFLIETKCPRYGWARASLCPCVGFNGETDQPDPKCSTCSATGWLYFKPQDYVSSDETIGSLDDAQNELLTKANAVVIRALLVNATSKPDIFAVLGRWALGSSMATVRAGNRLGYYDRLIGLDDEMVFSEVVETDGTSTTLLRYPAVDFNVVQSETTVYTDDDLAVDAAGNIAWVTGKEPAAGTKISVHYNCHPVWTVMEHTKLSRTSLVKQKKANPATPAGDLLVLPPQALVRLEHLPLDPGA